MISRRLEINGDSIKTSVHCCGAVRTPGTGRVSGAGVVFLCRFPLRSRTYSIHEISSMFVFFFLFRQKLDFGKERTGWKKSSQNDDNEHWSLYTRKTRTLRPPSFGCYICFQASRPPASLVAPKPGDATVPKTGVIEKKPLVDSSPSLKIFLWQPRLYPPGVPQRSSPGLLCMFAVCLFFYMLLVSVSWSHLTLDNQTQTMQFPRGGVFDDKW